MDGASEAAIAKVFAEILCKKSISDIVRTVWHVQEVDSYALSKSQPPTILGDPQNVEKNGSKKVRFFWSRTPVFVYFCWILEELDNFRSQNQLPHDILLHTDLF